jgi:hypothetical protein
MDDRHDLLRDGRVLVRDGRIVAVWSGPRAPHGVRVGDASVVREGPSGSGRVRIDLIPTTCRSLPPTQLRETYALTSAARD